jgi:hypothetical protein
MFAKVKETVDIVRHIGNFIELRGTRMPMEACCPFHEDKSPSFKVWADHWWCFGCGKGGSVIDFEMARQSMSAVDAAQFLCNSYNIVVSREESERYAQAEQSRQQKSAIAAAIAASAAERPELLDYLTKERGFGIQTIKDLGLGVGTREKVIVVPIKDKYGRPVAFARRHLDPEQIKLHKWVNDPESEIYKKKTILYNLDQARRHLNKDHLAVGQRLVLVESYFDVAALWEAGIKTGAAYCSANVTSEQSQEIKLLVTPGMTILFGACNDKTAQDKLLVNRTMIRSVAPDVHIRAIVIPDDCKDLNDVLIKHGPMGLSKIVADAISMDQYLLDQILDAEPVLEVQYRKAKQIVSIAENPLSQRDMVAQLAKRWNKDESTVSHYMLGRGGDAATGSGLQFDNLGTLITKYETHVRNLDNNVIKFGWERYDKLTRGMHRGDVVQLVAPSGVGKTTWAESLMLSVGKSYPNVPQIFFSMEQQGIMAFERFMQMEGEMEGRDVEKWMVAGDDAHNSKIFGTAQRLLKNLDKLLVCDQGGLTLQQIEEQARLAGFSYFGSPVGVVYIDYLGYLRGDGKSVYEQVSNIARQQKEMAKRLNCVVVSLHQVVKTLSQGDEVDESHARDSSAIRDSADILFTAWRPEMKKGILETEKNEKRGVWCCKVAKNRYGPTGDIIEMMFVPKFMQLKERPNPITDAALKQGRIVAPSLVVPNAPGFSGPPAGGFQ